ALPAPAVRRFSSATFAWAIAAIATIGLAISLLLPRGAAPAASAPTFMAIGAPEQRFFTHPSPAISRDGTTIAFWAPAADHHVKLWVRNLPSPQARALPGTDTPSFSDDSGSQPAFSPDGRSLLALFGGKLHRVPLDGGSPQVLADAPQPRSATWGTADQ